jgi:hypothetical protein
MQTLNFEANTEGLCYDDVSLAADVPRPRQAGHPLGFEPESRGIQCRKFQTGLAQTVGHANLAAR